MKKIIISTLALLFLIMGVWFFTSPFQYNKTTGLYQLENEITINQSVEKVFSYLGNSANASKWSSYVSHINALNENEVSDGALGSTRRCFKNKNGEGIFWDEEIVNVKVNELRELTVYNLNGFLIEADHLFTRQKYASISEGQTNLVFGLYKPQASHNRFIDWLKLKISGHYVAYIFHKNLNNIKKEVESLDEFT